CQHSYTIPFTF
nr:immunoglobulin light chain junction region [Macaca mulatta]MOW44254.1 immunoglobulin light chain junction region [Macaca mulatta]